MEFAPAGYLGGDAALLAEYVKLQLQDPNNDPASQAALLDTLSKFVSEDDEEIQVAPAFEVPVEATNNPQVFAFFPPDVNPAWLFRLTPELSPEVCSGSGPAQSRYWVPGTFTDIRLVLPSGGELLGSSYGPYAPGADMGGEFKASGEWTTMIEFTNPPQGKQAFKWTTSMPNLAGGVLQASVLPFPSGTEGDLLAPTGLVAQWDVTCSNCQFTVDVSILAPKTTEAAQPIGTKFSGYLQQLPTTLGKVFSKAWGALQSFFTTSPPVLETLVNMQPSSLPPGSSSVLSYSGTGVPPAITKYYFRMVPIYKFGVEDQIGGGPTNSVRIQYYTTDTIAEMMKQAMACQNDPSLPGCPPPPPERPYVAEIISYHGYLAATHCAGGYVVTENAKGVLYGMVKEYKAGDHICPPKPKSGKSWWEAVVDFIVDAVDWVSEAYDDLQAAVVDAVAQFVPSPPCGKECLGSVLKIVLMTTGIPPNIPDFDSLVNGGIDYLAEQAAQQVGIPEAVTKDLKGNPLTGALLEEAEAEWKKQVKEEFKQGIQEGLKAAQYAYADQVSWLPKGVPVKPDPLSSIQPAAAVIKITRKMNNPPSADTCYGSKYFGYIAVDAYVTVPDNIVQSFNKTAPKNQQMQAGHKYQLYLTLWLPIPQLGPGDSIEIPVTLQSAVYAYLGNPWTLESTAKAAYSEMYWNSPLTLSVSNMCTDGDSIKVSPDGSFGPQ